jgi:hypothetical protein
MSKALKKVSRKQPAFIFTRKSRKTTSSTVEKVDFLLELNKLEETLLRQIKKEIH